MTLIVETGAGLTNAQTYASAATVLAYCNSHGLPNFAALTALEQEPVVLRAMRWLESTYRGKWKGQRSDIDQALAWPRVGVADEDQLSIDSDVVPQVVIDALCLAAEREALGVDTLAPDLDRGGMVTQETIGPMSVSYARNAPGSTTFPAIARLLTGVTRTGGVTATVRRT